MPESDTVVEISPGKVLPSLKSRVERKRAVLEGWVKNGVPVDKVNSLPSSLNEAREWEDRDLLVFAIGSPNSFTKSHPDVGDDVTKIGELLTILQTRVRRPREGKRRGGRATISVKEIEETLRNLVSQWHGAREEMLRERERAVLAEQHLKIARSEVQKKNEEIADLRRRLNSGLTIIR